MKYRQIKRLIWLTCSDFTRKVNLKACIYEQLAIEFDKRQRRALIHGSKYVADYSREKASYYDAKANHYRNYLRTH